HEFGIAPALGAELLVACKVVQKTRGYCWRIYFKGLEVPCLAQVFRVMAAQEHRSVSPVLLEGMTQPRATSRGTIREVLHYEALAKGHDMLIEAYGSNVLVPAGMLPLLCHSRSLPLYNLLEAWCSHPRECASTNTPRFTFPCA